MRASCLLLCLALPTAGGTPLRVAAVERRGWPPYEDDRRTYRISGEDAAALHPGEVLQLLRPGDPRDPGRLKVAALDGGQALAYLDARGSTYPLVGDLARARRAEALPALPAVSGMPDVSLRPPRLAPPREAIHPASAPAAVHREPVFFLEGDASLSPKGREKLQRLVQAWGAAGPWVLAVPADRVLPEAVRQARIQALRRALAALGASRIEVRDAPRPESGPADVVYVEKG